MTPIPHHANGSDYLLVGLPIEATNIEIVIDQSQRPYGNMIKYFFLGNVNGLHGSQYTDSLPSGIYELFLTTSQEDESKAGEVVECALGAYLNHLKDLWEFDTATEALCSLFASHGMITRNPYGEKPEHLYGVWGTDDRDVHGNSNEHWFWQSAQDSLVLGVILRRVG